MAKGFVYIMTTAVDGIIKIGRSKDWNRRCQFELEENGYKNMNALKTYYVVEVEDDNEIESIMHDIFRESRVIGSKDTKTELFAVDKDRAKRVLSKMGIQVYPESDLHMTNDNSAPSIYSDFWSKFNNELKKSNSEIKVKASSFSKHYHTITKNNIYSVIAIKYNHIDIVFGSNDKKIFTNNILNQLSTINALSNLKFTDASYTKSTGTNTYQIKATMVFDINNYKTVDIKTLITEIEPIYKQLMN